MLPQRAQVPEEMPSYTEGAPPRGQLLLFRKGWVLPRLHTVVANAEGTRATKSESAGSARFLGLLGSSQSLSYLSCKMSLSGADSLHSFSASLPMWSAHCPRVPAHRLFLCGLPAKNGFYIFKWLEKIKRRVLFHNR